MHDNGDLAAALSTDLRDHTALGSLSGSYEFEPVLLSQFRPPGDVEDFLMDGMYSVVHERCHWFQFAGTTIGSAYLTLLRAEDVLIRHALSAKPDDLESRQYLESRILSAAAFMPFAFSEGQPTTPIPEWIRTLRDDFLRLREARLLLIDPHTTPKLSSDSHSQVLAHAFAAIRGVYRMHTGEPDTVPGRWSPTSGIDAQDLSPRGVSVGDEPLSTIHLFETGALLNQLAPELHRYWRGSSFERGVFAGAENEESAYLTRDALAAASSTYTLALHAALESWSGHLGDLADATLEARLARILPSLLCVIDIALNPPLPPICGEPVANWAHIFPPSRFMKVLHAVRDIGLMDWPDNEYYIEYRSELCAQAGLTIGETSGRSHQHPDMTDHFFQSAESEHPLLERLSSFDYLIWAMESLHALREEDPLACSMSWLMSNDATRFLAQVGRGGFMWTPIIWQGDLSFGPPGISAAVTSRIQIDLAMGWILKRMFVHGDPVDLRKVFDRETLADPAAVRSAMVHLISDALGVDCSPRIASVVLEERTAFVRGLPASVANIFEIPRREVESCDLAPMVARFDELRRDPWSNLNSVDFHFNGFGGDRRGLWDIPAVVDYLAELRRHVTGWAWYLHASDNPERGAGFFLVFRTSLADPRDPTPAGLSAWLQGAYGSLNAETEVHERVDRARAARLNEEQSARIYEATNVFRWAHLA